MATVQLLACLLSAWLSGPASPASTRSAGTQPQENQSVLQVAEPVYDFGEVWRGTVIEHDFQVTNASDEVVWLEAVPTCHCTATERNYRIDPHQTIPIRVRFNTAGRDGSTQSIIPLKITRSEKPQSRA